MNQQVDDSGDRYFLRPNRVAIDRLDFPLDENG
jgi:hypothetical protein